MEKYNDLQDKVFQESRLIISELGSVNTVEDLINSEEDLFLLLENISFFRVMERNFKAEDVPSTIIEEVVEQEEEIKQEFEFKIHDEEVEEEVIFNNELNEISNEDISYQNVQDDKIVEGDVIQLEVEEEIEVVPNEEPQIKAEPQLVIEEPVAEEVVEEKKIPMEIHVSPEEESEEAMELRRIKLAHIKGLKKEETVEEVVHEDSSSLLKSHVSTEYMEAPKAKPEFRLDFNDKIAFTKTLFGGEQEELNKAIHKLNSFQTLDEAKEYLSELYYDRKWDKVDDYAQRLWSLVENKFM